MNFRVNDLSNFIAAASCRTLSEGALRRGITQPSMSESIKRLERDLGCKLFYRSRDGIRLTPSGRITLDRGRKATETLIELEALRKSREQFQGRSVIIGCHHTVASYALPQALQTLSRAARTFASTWSTIFRAPFRHRFKAATSTSASS